MMRSYPYIFLNDPVTLCFFGGGCEVLAGAESFFFAYLVASDVVGVGAEPISDCVGFACMVESASAAFLFLVEEWGPDS